jgi:hypothetical protein
MKFIQIRTFLASLALAAMAAGQGPLTPSSGPKPTMKTLDEIEPRTPLNETNTPGDGSCVFKITQPGSYVLTSNFKPPSGKNGILIGLLLPGVVEVDMKGFTIEGSEAGAGTSGVVVNNGATQSTGNDFIRFANGTIRNFGGHACLSAATDGALMLRDLHISGGAGGVNAGGRLVMEDVIVSGCTGVPVRMGGDSALSRVTIKTTSPKVIDATGSGYKLSDLIVSSFSAGATQNGSAITLGPDSTVNGMRVRISNATYSGPVFGNTSGFTEVSGLDMTIEDVSAPSAFDSLLTSVQGPYQFTSSQGPYQLKAHNCTFAVGVGVVPLLPGGDYCPRIIASGTTNAPTVLRVNGSLCTIAADITLAPTTTITGGVITVHGAANTIRSNIRGMVGGGVGVAIVNEQGSAVTGCLFTGRNDSPVTGIRILSSATKVMVTNNRATGFANGSTFVDNQGGATNAIAPIVNAANMSTNTNPLANLAQ